MGPYISKGINTKVKSQKEREKDWSIKMEKNIEKG